jgi:hypothetical protein
MRMFLSIAAVAALGLAAAPTIAKDRVNARGEAKLAKALEGRVAGKPVSCINLSSIQSTEIMDGTAIVYRMSGNKLYVNRPRGGEFLLDHDRIMVTNTYGSQLCRLDLVRLVDRSSHFPFGAVGLGDFVPYTKPPKAG